jgi:hydrogenase expression/formation protein HypC
MRRVDRIAPFELVESFRRPARLTREPARSWKGRIMCLGIPMVVVEGDDMTALVDRRGEARRVSMMLVGEQAPGTIVLVHIDSAVRVLDAAEAKLIDDGLEGVAAALAGQDFEHLFADLVDREPQLPEFLRKTES